MMKQRHNKRSHSEGDRESPLTGANKRTIGFDESQANIRAVTEELDGKLVRKLRGYPVLFNVEGTPWRGSQWKEIIHQDALKETDFTGLAMLLDHRTQWVLARLDKNLRIEVDETGLFVEATLGDTWLDDYVFDRVQRGLIEGMSFWFDMASVIETDWDNKIDTIKKINSIYEVSIVTFPAYEDTAVMAFNDGRSAEPEDEGGSVAEDEARKQALVKLIESL